MAYVRTTMQRRRPRGVAAATPATTRNRCRALLVIDNRPLRNAAWSEFHATRKRLEKVTGDLHRHEEIDTPGYTGWLHATFPVLVSTLRELHQEVLTKSHEIEHVRMLASMEGRAPAKLWRRFKEEQRNPRPPEPPPREEAPPFDDPDDEDFNDFEKDFFKFLFGDEDPFEDGPEGGSFSSGRFGPPPAPTPTAEAKEIYRRLVQHLHPDRGGEWTPARERLWHEVQQAWAARDVDWLSRLDVEWDTANDTLSPHSPLSRLRRAIQELHAARRDAERKLRSYRGSYEWRFSLNEKKRPQLHARVLAVLEHDLDQLQRELQRLNTTIAAWEKPRGVHQQKHRRAAGRREP